MHKLILILLSISNLCFCQNSFLQIDTDPGIEVEINGVYRGKTAPSTGELFLKGLSSDTNIIKFSIYDFQLIDTLILPDSSLSHIEVNIIKGKVLKNSPMNRKLGSESLQQEGKLYYGSFKDERDQSIYKTIKIGDQIWMAENLHYNYGRGCYYFAFDRSKGKIYGRLYDWKTAMVSCPSGWHLATDEDWVELEKHLGMSEFAGFSRGWRDMEESGALKSSHKWNEEGNGSNNSGFSGLPGGYRDEAGVFFNEGNYAYFWTGTNIDEKDAFYRVLTYDIPNVGRFRYSKEYAFSVRCVKNK